MNVFPFVLGLTLVVWASAFAAIRAGLEGYSPFHLSLFRSLVVSSILASAALIRGVRRPAARDLPRLLSNGFFGMAVYSAALNMGERTVTAGAAGFLVNTAPVLTVVLAALFLRERMGAWGWAGLGVSITGAFLIAWGEGDGLSLDPGAGLILLAALCHGASFVIQKPLFARYSPFEVVCYAAWSATAALLIFWPGLPQAVATADIRTTAAIVYLGLLPGALGYVGWSWVLSRMPASRAASFLYIIPGLSVFIAWAWLGEKPHVVSVAGGIVALAGVALAQWGARR